MPLFSLPLNSSSTRPLKRAHFYPRTSKKRKRLSSPHVEIADEVKLPTSDPASKQSSFAAASTNPLSLAPDEVHQYKVAGLDLDQEIPSKSISDFPHRGLPSSFYPASHINDGTQTNDDGTEIDNGNLQRERKASHLRMQHLAVLTAILQRCLLEGDIPRASRAWAMLLRAQHNGKGIDTRSSGYWGIGAELLIRGGEKPVREWRVAGEEESLSSEDGKEEDNSDIESGSGKEGRCKGERRWGTAPGLEKAKDYYERLILQHPYTRQYPDSVNALDFWPAMLSCEIYGIQFEQKEALRNLTTEDVSDDVVMADSSSEEDESLRSADLETYFAAQQRREARLRERKLDFAWTKRDRIRHAALAAVEKLAARMDQLMATPPYADSLALQRLRGMVALYVGDLSVPDLFEVGSEGEGEGERELEGDDVEEDGGGRERERERERDGEGRGWEREREREGEQDGGGEGNEVEEEEEEEADEYGYQHKNLFSSNDTRTRDATMYGKLRERRLLQRRRQADHERGLARRAEEEARARKAFEKIQREEAGVGARGLGGSRSV